MAETSQQLLDISHPFTQTLSLSSHWFRRGSKKKPNYEQWAQANHKRSRTSKRVRQTEHPEVTGNRDDGFMGFESHG